MAVTLSEKGALIPYGAILKQVMFNPVSYTHLTLPTN